MLIPIRCFTCGSVTGDKWTPFVEAVLEQKNKSTEASSSDLDIEYININDDGKIEKSIEGKVLDDFGIHRYCCRRMFLGNVHLISYI
tara:strand:- start:880 stop:1140 length:261 start_codon:yes stop_codon:yes gene_type:complete